jgi:hypothetical protein
VDLKVSDGKDETSNRQDRYPACTVRIKILGLGMESTKEVSNEVKYEWYIDQGNTGQFSGVNCGPTSVTMAIKWADESFTGTPETARAMYHPSGGWWYTDNIIGYLNYCSVNNYV